MDESISFWLPTSIEELKTAGERFVVAANAACRLANGKGLRAKLLGARHDSAMWERHAFSGLVEPWLGEVFKGHEAECVQAAARCRGTLRIFARFASNSEYRVMRVPHPLHLALLAVEAPLNANVRSAFRHWVGRLLWENDRAGETITADDLATECAALVAKAREMRPLPSQFGTGASRIAARWLATLGCLSRSVPAKGRSGLRACAAFYGGRELRGATLGICGQFVADEGLARLLNGGLRTYREEGIAVLISGGPGSGKTSMALLLAVSAIFQGGCAAVFSAEESVRALRYKCRSTLSPFGPDRTEEWERGGWLRLHGIDGFADANGGDVHAFMRGALDDWEATRRRRWPDGDVPDAAPPLCLVLDSLTAFELARMRSIEGDLSGTRPMSTGDLRKSLFDAIQDWRRRGVVTVLVVGSKPTTIEEQAEYLADTVFRLDADGGRHVTVVKSRLQASIPEKHVVQISETEGFRVAPGGNVLAKVVRDRSVAPDADGWVPLLWRATGKTNDITAALTEGRYAAVFGTTAVGKSVYALRVLLGEPIPRGTVAYDGRRVTPPGKGIHKDNDKRLRSPIPYQVIPAGPLRGGDDRRVLVVSLTHSPDWYRRKAARVFDALYKTPTNRNDPDDTTHPRNRAKQAIQTITCYPGTLEPAVLLRKVERELDRGAPDGKPFTGVLIEGLHTVFHSYGTLAEQPWTWQALLAVAQERGCSVLSTYSLFSDDELQWSPTVVQQPMRLIGLLRSLAQAFIVIEPWAFGLAARAIFSAPLNTPEQLLFHWDAERFTFKSRAPAVIRTAEGE